MFGDDVFGSPGAIPSSFQHQNLFHPSRLSSLSTSGPQSSVGSQPSPSRLGVQLTDETQLQQEEDIEQPTFQAEQAFQLYRKCEYPKAGTVTAVGKPTIFHAMNQDIPEAYPYSPFFDEEEWGLAEFLTTS